MEFGNMSIDVTCLINAAQSHSHQWQFQFMYLTQGCPTHRSWSSDHLPIISITSYLLFLHFRVMKYCSFYLIHFEIYRWHFLFCTVIPWISIDHNIALVGKKVAHGHREVGQPWPNLTQQPDVVPLQVSFVFCQLHSCQSTSQYTSDLHRLFGPSQLYEILPKF